MKKLEELRRRRGITGLLGCPSDTKDPDDWDWDNWDNWPQEDKDMFPIEEEEAIRSMKESTYSDTDELYDRICRSLTDYEHNGEEETNFKELPDEYFIKDFCQLLEETLTKTDIREYAPDLADHVEDILQDQQTGAPVSAGELYDILCDVSSVMVYDSLSFLDKPLSELDESVSFVDKWHDTLEILPDYEKVWFIADGKIYVGMYEPEQKIFCMADGLGVPLQNVRQWKYVANKEVIGYPKEKQIVAVEAPEFPCPAVGIFSDHLIDEETGDEFSGIVLDEEYTFCENGCDSLHWEEVFAWYPLPEEPLNVIETSNSIEGLDIEFEKPEDDLDDLIADEGASNEVGPEPMSEVGPDPFAEVDAQFDAAPEVEPPVEGEEIPAAEPAAPAAEEVAAEPTPAAAPEQTGSAIAAANSNPEQKEEEEESLVKVESKENTEDRLQESILTGTFVKEWYKEEYPDDDMGDDIDPEITFDDVFEALDSYQDIYDVLGVGDSIIRERVFTKLADLMGVDYDYVYDHWLKGADKAVERTVDWNRIDPDYIEELYKKGQTTAEERDTALENIRKARGGIYEAVDKKNPHVREAKVYYEFPGSYRPWSGAVDTWEYIEENDAMDALENFIDECYPDGIGETELNDLLWFDSDYVYEALGLRNPDAEDEEDEDEEEEEEEDDYVPVSEEEYKGYTIYEWYEDDDDPDPNKTYFTVCPVGVPHSLGSFNSLDAAKKEIDSGKFNESKKVTSNIKKFKEGIRSNTKQFVDNVEKYLDGFGDDIWERLRVNIQYLQSQPYNRYGSLNEAIREYIEGGSLDVYYDEVRKTLNELYENTPKEAAKWENYPNDKLWERYINLMCMYLPKAYKKHTGKDLDMRKDPDSEYNQKIKAKYGERKLSVGEYLYERGLTKAEKHNKMMDEIFAKHNAIIKGQKDFLKSKGVSDEELDTLEKGTGLHGDAIGQKMRDMGCWDEYWKQNEKIQEHLENISDDHYSKWVKLKRKLDPEYLADYCIEALPKYEAELIIDYLADMNGVKGGDVLDWGIDEL